MGPRLPGPPRFWKKVSNIVGFLNDISCFFKCWQPVKEIKLVWGRVWLQASMCNFQLILLHSCCVLHRWTCPNWLALASSLCLSSCCVTSGHMACHPCLKVWLAPFTAQSLLNHCPPMWSWPTNLLSSLLTASRPPTWLATPKQNKTIISITHLFCSLWFCYDWNTNNHSQMFLFISLFFPIIFIVAKYT
jgi:hypothetical protein